MEADPSYAVVDVVTAAVKMLSLMAVLQACGMAIFVLLYGRYLVKSIRPLAALNGIAALAGAVLTLLFQQLGASRMAGEWSGAFDTAMMQLSWLSASGAAAGLRIAGMIAIWLAVKRNHKGLAFVGVAATVISFPLTGHTTTHSPTLLLQLLLAVHISVAAFWFGSLSALSVAVKHESGVDVVERFSQHATTLVPILGIAGIGMAWALLPNWAALATPYGLSIAIKANSFGVLLLLAALNKWRLTPAMARGEKNAFVAFRRSVMVEYVSISAVLAATALMTTLFAPE